MIKRALAAIFAILILGIAYTAVASLLTDGEPEQPQKRPEPVKGEPWSGEATHVYNTSLLRRGERLFLSAVEFRKLNLAKANAVVHLNADISDGGAEWLKPKRFYAYQYNARRAFRAKVSRRVEGASAIVELRFNGLPTAALGPTCQSKAQPADPIYLRMPGLPGGEVAIAITAPQPPAGSCLADPQAIAAAARAKMLAKRGVSLAKPQVKGKRIIVRGRVNANGLSAVRLELGRGGNFPQARQLKPKRGRFRAQMRAPRKGRFALRVVIEDPQAGTFTPKAAKRFLRVR